VRDWLSSPVDGRDALSKVRQMLRGETPAEAANAVVSDSYFFAFDTSLDELVIVDPQSGLVMDVNSTFEDRSGFSRDQVIGRAFSAMDLSTPPEQRREFAVALTRDGYVRYQCRKAHAESASYPVEVHIRLVVHNGQLRHFCTIRDVGEWTQARDALAFLAESSRRSQGENGVSSLVEQVAAWLNLDFFVVLAGAPDNVKELAVVSAFSRPDIELEGGEPQRLPVLRKLLGGEPVWLSHEAYRIASRDKFVSGNRFEMLLGLPLFNTEGEVMGAMVLASRQPLIHVDPIKASLEALAKRCALEIELRRSREDSRAQGLHDSLTRLPNRLLFNDRLSSAIAEAGRGRAVRSAVRRPRPFQDDQRQPRPRCGRPGTERSGQAPARLRARLGHGLALRR
jgi:PAS domain S-box-containing protein